MPLTRKTTRVRLFTGFALMAVLCAAVLVLSPTSARGQTAEPTGIGHFVCYASQVPANTTGFKTPPAVMLQNQFSTKGFLGATTPLNLHCNPVQKTLPSGAVTAVKSPSWHLACWGVRPNDPQPSRTVDVKNQFGQARLRTAKPNSLCLPSLKSEKNPPSFPNPGANEIRPDHLSCYPVTQVAGAGSFNRPAFVSLKDQFGTARTKIGDPKVLCLPTSKTIDPAQRPTAIAHSDSHLLCFAIAPDPAVRLPRTVSDRNQFGTGRVTAQRTSLLCLPSFKTVVT